MKTLFCIPGDMRFIRNPWARCKNLSILIVSCTLMIRVKKIIINVFFKFLAYHLYIHCLILTVSICIRYQLCINQHFSFAGIIIRLCYWQFLDKVSRSFPRIHRDHPSQQVQPGSFSSRVFYQRPIILSDTCIHSQSFQFCDHTHRHLQETEKFLTNSQFLLVLHWQNNLFLNHSFSLEKTFKTRKKYLKRYKNYQFNIARGI